MKKIIIFNIGTNIGGIETSLIQFLNYLSTMEVEIDLVLWKKPGELFEKIPAGIKILSSPSLGDIRKIIKNKNLKQILKYIQFRVDKKTKYPWKHFPNIKGKYDIAISYCQNGYSPYYVIDKVEAEKKYLFYHHGSYEKTQRAKKIDLIYYNQYDKIITVSNANKRMLEEHFPSLNQKIEVIHNLLDEDRIKVLASKQQNGNSLQYKGCKIVTIGRISNEKGQLFSIEVARILKQKKFEFHWIFVGDGPDKEKCLEKVKEYNLVQECEFVGLQLNPYIYMKSADIYVQTSSVEADPVTIQEAIILSKLIIASNILPMQEALENGKLGIVNELESEDFADSIISLYGDSEKQKVLLTNIQNHMSQNKATQDEIKRLLELEEEKVR